MGLSTDGASVMVGKTNGLAAKLRQRNSKLLICTVSATD